MNHSKKDQDFRNYIEYPLNNAIRKGNRPARPRPNFPFNASGGYNTCCGLAATGDGEAPLPVIAAAKVRNDSTWQVAKTVLMLVGLYAVGMYLWKIQK